MKGLKSKDRIEYWNYALPLIIAAHKDTGYFQQHSFTDDIWMHGKRVGGFDFSCAANNKKSRVELVLGASRNPELNRSAFDYLYARREEIERVFGDQLHWDRDSFSNSSFITQWNTRDLITDRNSWKELAWYHAIMSRRLYEIMTPLLRKWSIETGRDIESFVPIKQPLDELLQNSESATEKGIQNIPDDCLYYLAKGHSAARPIKETFVKQEYKRNPYVTAYAKRKALGKCQLCGNKAPFMDPNGEPYLEVHHIEWLMNGGADSIENTVALCPNCHRKMHSLNLSADIDKLKEAAKEEPNKSH